MLFFRGEVDRRVRNDLRGGTKTQTREEVLFADEEKESIATTTTTTTAFCAFDDFKNARVCILFVTKMNRVQ